MRLIWLAVLGPCAAAVAVAVSRVAYPYDAGLYEGSTWAPADLLAEGRTPYHVATSVTPPYVIATYGPLYYGIIAVGIRLVGDQFWVGRGVSLLALLLCAALVYLILSQRCRREQRWIPVAGAGLFLAQYPVQFYAGAHRPDVIGLALALSGLALVFSNISHPVGVMRAAAAGGLLALAVLVRQTIFLPILVALAWFVLRGNHRGLVACALAALVTASSVVAVLLITSNGGFIWHVWTAQASVSFQWSLALAHARGVLTSPATLVTLLMVAGGLLVGRSAAFEDSRTSMPEDRQFLRLVICWLAAAALLAFWTAAKAGSNINYWLEVTLVLSILAPLAWSHIDAPAWNRTRPARTCALLLAGTIAAGLFTGARVLRGEALRWGALPYFEEVVAKIRTMTSRRDPVLSDYPDLAVAAGRSYYFNDIAAYRLAPDLRPSLNRTLAGEQLKLLATPATVAPPGYARVCMKQAEPAGFYVIRIFYRVKRHQPNGKCVPLEAAVRITK